MVVLVLVQFASLVLTLSYHDGRNSNSSSITTSTKNNQLTQIHNATIKLVYSIHSKQDIAQEHVRFGDCGLAPLNDFSLYSKHNKRLHNKTATPYIINGYTPTYGQFPSYAHIKLRHPIGNGVLISDDMILTAGHLLFQEQLPVKLKRYDIVLGEHLLDRDDPYEQHRRVVAKCFSPEMTPPGKVTRHHDFAIMSLNKPVELNDYVQPACLPDETTRVDYTTCHVVGGGAIAKHGKFAVQPKVLQAMPVRKVNCDKYWPTADPATSCWTKAGGDGDTCNGDSGGPILCLDKDWGRWFVVAITSHGDANCNGKSSRGWVAIYSDILALRPVMKAFCDI